MALNLSGTSGITGAGIGTIGPSGANVTGVGTFTSIISSGSVGIGTTNPQTFLHVDGTSNSNARITISRTAHLRNNWIGLQDDADNLAIAVDEGNAGPDSEIRFRTDGGTRVYIKDDGKVGINRSAPDGMISVANTEGSISATETLCGEFRRDDGTRNPRFHILHNQDGTILKHTYSTSAPNLMFKIGGTEISRMLSTGGITFNGDTAAANAIDDYEQGDITTWRLIKNGADTSGTNTGDTKVTYTKIGDMVTISGWIRTNGTEGGESGNAKLVTVADTSVAATLPYTPNHSGGLIVTQTRTLNVDANHTVSVGFLQDNATLYIYLNDAVGDYTPTQNNLSCNTQTNLVICFNGVYRTNG